MSKKNKDPEIEDHFNELKIVVERDAHDDTYYQLLNGSYIVAERINDIDDLMLLVRAKIKKMG